MPRTKTFCIAKDQNPDKFREDLKKGIRDIVRGKVLKTLWRYKSEMDLGDYIEFTVEAIK